MLSRDSKRTVWRGNNHHNKEKIPNDDLDVPTRSPEKSKRDRSQNKYIEFTPTDVYKDIAQTTGIYLKRPKGITLHFTLLLTLTRFPLNKKCVKYDVFFLFSVFHLSNMQFYRRVNCIFSITIFFSAVHRYTASRSENSKTITWRW